MPSDSERRSTTLADEAADDIGQICLTNLHAVQSDSVVDHGREVAVDGLFHPRVPLGQRIEHARQVFALFAEHNAAPAPTRGSSAARRTGVSSS